MNGERCRRHRQQQHQPCIMNQTIRAENIKRKDKQKVHHQHNRAFNRVIKDKAVLPPLAALVYCRRRLILPRKNNPRRPRRLFFYLKTVIAPRCK